MGGAGSYLLVVLLEAAELLPQRLELRLQVRPAERELVQDLPQAVDVSLHALAQGQLRLVPAGKKELSVSDTTVCSFPLAIHLSHSSSFLTGLAGC